MNKFALVAKLVGSTCLTMVVGDALKNVASRVYDSTNPEEDESDAKYIVTKCGLYAASYMAANVLVTKMFNLD